jgi:dTDP-4-dehydrorhamnose 3,5-epimerase
METDISGAVIIDFGQFEDERGFFARIFCRQDFAAHGLDFNTMQANISGNHAKGVLRGLHYQAAPYAEAKLVRAISGAIFDVIVDLRLQSPTFGNWAGCTLSADNKLAFLAPEGCAHGYLTLEPGSEILYLVSAPYNKKAERGLRFDDPFFKIDWPFPPAVISDKDRSWPYFTGSAK